MAPKSTMDRWSGGQGDDACAMGYFRELQVWKRFPQLVGHEIEFLFIPLLGGFLTAFRQFVFGFESDIADEKVSAFF